ncbi:hypothetical protein BTVI_91831 [Pitangus sulphuratus]|nr:hypothetical protein BTVI_91831 [Pitangus sulphuratus]
MKFNRAKCKILHLGRGNLNPKYKLKNERIESKPEEKGLQVLVDKKLDINLQRVLAAQKANCILCCMKSSVAEGGEGSFVRKHCIKRGPAVFGTHSQLEQGTPKDDRGEKL